MLAETMPPPKKTARVEQPDPAPERKEQFNVRLPPELRAGLESWLGELNEGRRVPMKLSDMVRGILEHAVENRPDWERVGGPATSERPAGERPRVGASTRKAGEK